MLAAVPPPTPLEGLPLDVHRIILASLDAPSLARFSECVNRGLAKELAPSLGVLWDRLSTVQHDMVCMRATPEEEEEEEAEGKQEAPAFVKPKPRPTADDAKACKSYYVRTFAMLNQRCARCGRQGPQMAALVAAGQRHLCDFFAPRPRSGSPDLA